MKLNPRLLQRVWAVTAALVLGLAGAPAAFAQSDAADPPGRVGRLAELIGQVWLFTPESGEWVNATRNRPLTAGDRLSTDADARAEVRIGSTTLRLDSGSELEVLRLDDERISLQLHNGSLAARLRNREAAAEFELKTGEGLFTVQRAGRYRFDRQDATSDVTVYNGQALYEGPRNALTVNSGQRAEFWIDASDVAQYSITEPRRDAFSAWNGERDRGDDRSVSARFVSPEMTGVEDLDRNGRWEQSPEYGALWIPRGVAPGWAPYSTGRWAWVRPWGWTWVDDAPWGFAPFHYGRWVYFGNAWCWSPGTYVARPVYAPALVAWVGGPSVSVSLSIGGSFGGPAVGWFPLAPREVYVPSYRVSPRYAQNINITHVTNVTNITNVINAPGAPRDFSNRKFPHAVTVVPTSVMTGRQPVGPAADQLRNAPEVRDLVQQPARHGVLLAPPVAAPPPGVVRAIEQRPGTRPVRGGESDRGPSSPAPGQPGQRERDGERTAPPGVVGPAISGAGAIGPVRGAPPPAAGATPPTAQPTTPAQPQVQAPNLQPPNGRRTIPERPDRGDRAEQPGRPDRSAPPALAAPTGATPMPNASPSPAPAAAPAAQPAPPMRGVPRAAPGAPPTGAAPAAGPAPPVAPRNPAPVERPMPERRHHGEPAAAPAPAPKPAAEVPNRGKPEPRVQEEKGEPHPRQRERNMAN